MLFKEIKGKGSLSVEVSNDSINSNLFIYF